MTLKPLNLLHFSNDSCPLFFAGYFSGFLPRALVRFGTGALIICYKCKGRRGFGPSAVKIRQHVIRWGSTYDAWVLLTLTWPLSVYI